MVKFEFFKLWFVLFYIYKHDVTFTLYINWTVFLHKSSWSTSAIMFKSNALPNYLVYLELPLRTTVTTDTKCVSTGPVTGPEPASSTTHVPQRSNPVPTRRSQHLAPRRAEDNSTLVLIWVAQRRWAGNCLMYVALRQKLLIPQH